MKKVIKKTTLKKKRKESENVIPQVLEWKDWKAGDLVYGERYNGKIVYGEIKQFHLNDAQGVAVQMLEFGQGAYVTVLASTLSEKDPKKNKIRRKK